MATPRISTGKGTIPVGVTASLTIGGVTTALTATATASTRVVISIPTNAVNDDLDVLVPKQQTNRYIYIPSTGAFAKIKSRPGLFIFETETPITAAGVGFQIVESILQSFSVINVGTADGTVAASSVDGSAGYALLVAGESNDINKDPNFGRDKYVNAWAFDATGTTFKIIESII